MLMCIDKTGNYNNVYKYTVFRLDVVFFLGGKACN